MPAVNDLSVHCTINETAPTLRCIEYTCYYYHHHDHSFDCIVYTFFLMAIHVSSTLNSDRH